MAGFCKKCGYPYELETVCAQCASPVGMDGVFNSVFPPPAQAIEETPDGPSFLRRLGLGIIAVVGFYYGLVHLTLAIAIEYSGITSLAVEGSLGLLVAATLAGATAAGTMNRRAELTGLLLGLGASAGFIAMETHDARLPEDEGSLAVVASLGLVGLIGGVAGRLMVPPAPHLPKIGQLDQRKMNATVKPRIRIVWWRIVMAVVLVFLGTFYADSIRFVLSKVFSGHGGSAITGKVLSWQVSLIVAVAGGVLAGSNTRRGFLQGLIAGLFAAPAAFFALTQTGKNSALVLEFWFDQLKVKSIGPELIAAICGSVWAGVAVGGWLGSHVFPPRRR